MDRLQVRARPRHLLREKMGNKRRNRKIRRFICTHVADPPPFRMTSPCYLFICHRFLIQSCIAEKQIRFFDRKIPPPQKSRSPEESINPLGKLDGKLKACGRSRSKVGRNSQITQCTCQKLKNAECQSDSRCPPV